MIWIDLGSFGQLWTVPRPARQQTRSKACSRPSFWWARIRASLIGRMSPMRAACRLLVLLSEKIILRWANLALAGPIWVDLAMQLNFCEMYKAAPQ
jgi:hypothetical protein